MGRLGTGRRGRFPDLVPEPFGNPVLLGPYLPSTNTHQPRPDDHKRYPIRSSPLASRKPRTEREEQMIYAGIFRLGIKAILPVLLLASIQTRTVDLIAHPVSQCEGTTTCPEHNVTANFDMKTKLSWNLKVSRNCTYGEYSHMALADSEHKSSWTHRFWESCGCD